MVTTTTPHNQVSQKKRILIADDHFMIREGMKQLIARMGCLVVAGEAETGTQCIKLFNELNPDLLILDISMPELNGLEVSRRILLDHPQANIIILSMHNDEDYISKCIENGVRGYVIKNESGAELEEAIRMVSIGKNYFSKEAHSVVFRKYSKSIAKKTVTAGAIMVTNREKDILRHLADGLTSSQIADKLFISTRTVETHRANLMKKLEAKNAIELLKKVFEKNLLRDN